MRHYSYHVRYRVQYCPFLVWTEIYLVPFGTEGGFGCLEVLWRDTLLHVHCPAFLVVRQGKPEDFEGLDPEPDQVFTLTEELGPQIYFKYVLSDLFCSPQTAVSRWLLDRWQRQLEDREATKRLGRGRNRG